MPPSVLFRSCSMITHRISALSSLASEAFGPLPIQDATLLRAVSLSHRYSRSLFGDAAWSVLAIAASSGLSELEPSSLLPTLAVCSLFGCCRRTLPAPMPSLLTEPSPAHVSPGNS